MQLVRLRSEPDLIAVDWLEPDESSRTAGLSALSEYARRRVDDGPSPRLALPPGHPHQDEYVYDGSSLFRYVDLTVVLVGDTITVENDYGTEMPGQAGADGPLRPWSDFMLLLMAEIERRSG